MDQDGIVAFFPICPITKQLGQGLWRQTVARR
jgi:hypothetical protein